MATDVRFDREVPGFGRARPQRLVLDGVGFAHGAQHLRWADIEGVSLLQVMQRANGVATCGQQYLGLRAGDRVVALRQSVPTGKRSKGSTERAELVAATWTAMVEALEALVLPRLTRELTARIASGDAVELGGRPLVKVERAPRRAKPVVATREGLTARQRLRTRTIGWAELADPDLHDGQVLLRRTGATTPVHHLPMTQENAVLLPELIRKMRGS